MGSTTSSPTDRIAAREARQMPRTSATGKHRPRRHRQAAGFTLIELLVVLAILTLMATVFPWAISHSMRGHRLLTARADLASEIRRAQRLSAASGGELRLVVRDHGYALV